MKHHIIVKFTEQAIDKASLEKEIAALFAGADQLPGVHGAHLYPNVIDRPNRYDLMIVVHMDREALPVWDASDIHHRWKEGYGHLIAQKAIFDCE